MNLSLRVVFSLMIAALVPACDKPAPDTIPLEIKGANSSHKFVIEIARTRDEQDRGLMFRKSLAPDGGMIFPVKPVCEASFWMKDTVIPLDMIFIRADGTIAKIEADTTPYSKIPVSSGESVAAVLEIAGGRASELGIAEGDKVIWKSEEEVSAQSSCATSDQ
jgi:uncharacterized membrane protein (UPF0127 family)